MLALAMCIPCALMALLLMMAWVESWLDSWLDREPIRAQENERERAMTPTPSAVKDFQELELM